MDKGRVEVFSDGVFAIAITLLVLDISLAPSDYDHLRHALLNEWPAYLAYVTSFPDRWERVDRSPQPVLPLKVH